MSDKTNDCSKGMNYLLNGLGWAAIWAAILFGIAAIVWASK